MLRGRLPRRISVAPMVDVTGPPFLYLLRLISPHAHYQLYSEMIHANAFTRGKIMTHKPSLHQHIFVGDPHFKKAMTVQLGGYEEKAVSVASRYLAKELGVSEINLNVGCPSKNVQAGSFGAVLMKTPLQVASTCRAMEDAVDAKAEITVKCRIGVDHEESFDFVRRFVDTVASKTKVSHFIVHARRAWLKGLSPKDNLTAPPLNYPIVYQLANEYPDLKFTINGGIDDLDSIKGHLNFVDGVMMGRKIRDDPWFLTEMDTNLFGIGESSIPSREYVLDKYLARNVLTI
ncbi:hypothetical protein H4219_001218 [Mycoemilia scoparia]|uniref:tRNA-dihydrouridine synthase n=1 Tax=Mycoemilia scoparia TaxID=417184 RepID=A0A9W8A431_9FUNG|nr:hypothetical protein H4219_001218 [Mycoemilia scoparia]